MFDSLRTAEFLIAGFLIPWAMVIWTVAYLVALVVWVVAERAGFYRAVWHPPLFFVSLVLIVGSLLGLFLAP